MKGSKVMGKKFMYMLIVVIVMLVLFWFFFVRSGRSEGFREGVEDPRKPKIIK